MIKSLHQLFVSVPRNRQILLYKSLMYPRLVAGANGCSQRHFMSSSYSTMRFAQTPSLISFPKMCLSSTPPDGAPGNSTPANEDQKKSTSKFPYIKEMETSKDWQDALENRVRPVIIQAGAEWCGPCQTIKPMLTEAVKAREGKVEYLYMDIDKHPKLAQTLRIQSVPVVYLVRDGQLIDQFSGVPQGATAIDDFIEKGLAEPEPMGIEKLNEGAGPTVPKGATVKVHYTGKLQDGTVFDSSVERGDPLEFKVGVGQVIRGWDEGICQLQKGQKAILTCPPAYAYGSQGAGDVIPPNATLQFEVEVIDYKE